MPTKDDEEFVEKVRTIGFNKGYKPGKTHDTPVINEDGTVGGKQVEHHDGSVDAVVIPPTVKSRSRTQEGTSS